MRGMGVPGRQQPTGLLVGLQDGLSFRVSGLTLPSFRRKEGGQNKKSIHTLSQALR
jgi:hypothetical protein